MGLIVKKKEEILHVLISIGVGGIEGGGACLIVYWEQTIHGMRRQYVLKLLRNIHNTQLVALP